MTSDVALARELALSAGERLLALRRERPQLDVAELRQRGDLEAQRVLSAGLTARRPRDAVLSEEAPNDETRLTANRVWIVDPLDGTREFAEGRSDWAVHVALWEAGELTAGAVALPSQDVVLTSERGDLPVRSLGRARLAVSRTRAPEVALQVAAQQDYELVPMGSAGVKMAAVARGEVDMYVHAGGQYEWDSAAPVAVARGHGLFASRLDGSALAYNQPDPYLPDIVVCRPELASSLLAAIAEVLEASSAEVRG